MSDISKLLNQHFQKIMKQYSERIKKIQVPHLNFQNLPVFEELRNNMQELTRLTEGMTLKNQEAFTRVIELNNRTGLKALSEQMDSISKELRAQLSIDIVTPVLRELQASLNGLEISDDEFVKALQEIEKQDYVAELEKNISNTEQGYSTAQGISIGVNEIMAFLMFILMLIQTIDDSNDKALKKLIEEQNLTNQLLHRLVNLNSNSQELIEKSKDEDHELLITNKSVPLRSQPNVNSNALITLFKGQHLDLLDEKGDWYKVKFYDITTSDVDTGWIKEKYIIPKIEIEQVQTKKLSDIATSSKGKKPDMIENEPGEGLIPYVDIQGFEDREFRKYTDGKGGRLCDEGDLLIVWDGSRSGLVGKAPAGAIGSTLAKIEINGVTNDYGYYFLKSHYQYLNTNPKGTGTPHVDPDLLWDLDIRVPPLEEQHRIVEKIETLFSELGNGIENLKKTEQQLEIYKQSVLKAAFEGKLTKEWREQQDDLPMPEELKQQIEEGRKKYREQQLSEWQKEVEEWKANGEEGRKPRKPRKLPDLKPFKDDELNKFDQIPRSWLWLRTQEVGEWQGGGTPRRSNNDYWQNGTIPWVSPKDMKRKDISSSKDLMTEKALKESSSAKMVNKGSILFVTRSGILRRTLPVAIAMNELTINQDLKALTPVINLSTEYIYWYCQASNLKIRRKCSKDGTTVESIKTKALKNYPIPICSQKEQEKLVSEIESKVSVIEQVVNMIEQELQKAEALRQSILKKAFEGKLIQ